jgi:hypothetical protein
MRPSMDGWEVTVADRPIRDIGAREVLAAKPPFDLHGAMTARGPLRDAHQRADLFPRGEYVRPIILICPLLEFD